MAALIPLAKPDISELEIDYVNRALRSGWISSKGSFIQDFERRVAARHGSDYHAIAVSSGTAALHLALLAAGIGRNDRVLVPNVTFGSTLNTVLHVGADPVLIDIDETLCMDVKGVILALRQHRNVKAIMPVFLYGNTPDPRLWIIAEEFKLTVIEDRAECVEWGPPLKGHYACYSFYANKAITTGEGGMVVTRWPDAVRLYRDHGMTHPYYHLVPGLNYRMTNLQAAIGVAQMERCDDFLRRRLRNLRQLRAGIPGGQGEWLYVVPRRGLQGVETRPVFDPLHTLPYVVAGDNFPNSVRLHRDHFCLPCGHHLDEQDVAQIISAYQGAA